MGSGFCLGLSQYNWHSRNESWHGIGQASSPCLTSAEVYSLWHSFQGLCHLKNMTKFRFIHVATLCSVHSVEIWGYFCHSDFTWNPIWQCRDLKNCHFHHFCDSESRGIGNFKHFSQKSKCRASKMAQIAIFDLTEYLNGRKFFCCVNALCRNGGNFRIFCQSDFTWNQF